MIGLLFLLSIGLWLVATILLSIKIPRWLGIAKHAGAVSLLLFPIVLIAPVADEVIGRWQFRRLCDREAVVTLSPDWVNVTRASDSDYPSTEIGGYFLPIRVQHVEYLDLDTGKPFLIAEAFHTNGGILFGRLGLGLGNTTSCWPNDLTKVMNDLNIDALIKKGKTK